MSNERKPRRGPMPPLPEMSPQRRKVHERALRLGYGSWDVVQYLPSVCARIPAPVPRWAAELLKHCEALSYEAPLPVLEALLDMGEKGCASPRTREARRWGSAMGLWTGHTHGVDVWPLGEAVANAWRARQPPTPDDAPSHAQAWAELGVRCSALVRTASGAVAMVGTINERNGCVSLLFRSRTGTAMPGTKLTVIADPGEDHPDREAFADKWRVPYVSRRWRPVPWE